MKWLSKLDQQLGLGAELCKELHRQLAGPFEQLTNEDLDDFVLVPTVDRLPPRLNRFTIVHGGGFDCVRGELLNVDTLFPVSFRWKVAGGSIQSSEWTELPFGEIRQALAKRRDVPFRRGLPFQVEITDPIWPHLRLTFRTTSALMQDVLATLERRLLDWVDQWNDGPMEAGRIHSSSRLQALDANRFSVTIDFGSTGKDALDGVLELVSEAIALEQVTLDHA